MAIYHLSVKIIGRSAGRSSVAAAAYRSGDTLTNEWDGITHDYSKKHWIEHTEIILPPNAPKEYKDRSALWNAVEKAETSGTAQLAREVEAALPVELSYQEQLVLVRSYIQENFISKGMCADFAIHNPPLTDEKGRPLDMNGNPTNDRNKMIFQNPHAHILLTMRPLDKDGNWEPKSHTIYLCRKGREEQAFSAKEIQAAESEGWQKQYAYKIGKKKVWLTDESGERQGFKRVNKQPKTRKEMNPVLQEWNSKESVFRWRENWAASCNEAFKRNGITVRIDSRSYEEQGVNRLPQTHLGPQAWQMEKAGIRTEKGDLNRRIRENNRFLKTFEEQIKDMERREKERLERTAARLEGLRARAVARVYEKISLSALLAAAEKQEQDDFARAAVYAKAIEQVMAALDALMEAQEETRKELSSCGSLERKRKETLKETILQNEKQIESLKEHRRVLMESYGERPKQKKMNPETMAKWKARIAEIQAEQNKINREFQGLVRENQAYMKEFRVLCKGRRSEYQEQTKNRLMEHYKDDFSEELLRKSEEQAPELPEMEDGALRKEHHHKR